jgi:hypothetical protein
MSRLNPQLKKLVRWAAHAPPTAPRVIPPGFAARVTARQGDSPASSVLSWEMNLWDWAWTGAAVVLLTVAVLAFQKLHPASPYDLSPAYQVVSIEFVP